MALEKRINLVLALLLVVAVAAGFYLSRRRTGGGGPAPTGTPAAEAHPTPTNKAVIEAVDKVEAKDWDGARALLETVRADDPDYATAVYNLAIIYEKLGAYDAAFDAYGKLRPLMPDSSEPFTGMGWIHFLRGEFLEAERATLRALELDCANSIARYNLGLYRLAQKRLDAAVETYQRAFAYDTDRSGFVAALNDLRGYRAAHPRDYETDYVRALFYSVVSEHGLEVNALESVLAYAPPGRVREMAEERLAEARRRATEKGIPIPSPSAEPAAEASPSPGAVITTPGAATPPAVASPSPRATPPPAGP